MSGSAPETAPKFEALDLESASGRYHTVTCLDVMIHYPQVGPADTICALFVRNEVFKQSGTILI